MYQYGNVALKYQTERKNKPKLNHPKKQEPKRQIRTNPNSNPRTSRFSAMEKMIYLFSVIIISGALILIMNQSAALSQINFNMQSTERDIVQVQEKNNQLELEVLELRSPDRIMKIAKSELNMKVEESQVKILSQ